MHFKYNDLIKHKHIERDGSPIMPDQECFFVFCFSPLVLVLVISTMVLELGLSADVISLRTSIH